MRLLVITTNPWDDRIASGNTLSNLLGGLNSADIFCIYSRDARPYTNCCQHFFTVSPFNLLRHYLVSKHIGRQFVLDVNNSLSGDTHEQFLESNAKRVSKHYGSFSKIVYDLIYYPSHWINQKLQQFIFEANPDLVFCWGTGDSFTYNLIKYLKNHTTAEIVSYFVDDHYRSTLKKVNLFRRIQRKRLKFIATTANQCYGISRELCEEYSRLLGCQFKLLHKGADLKAVKNTVNTPLRFIYAGNLLYGRDDTLHKLIMVMKNINAGQQLVKLDIFTGSPKTDEIISRLNDNETSFLHDSQPYDTIKELMHESDVVLHVESFDSSQFDTVRLSFSTKIIDCLQAGVMMMAIGPEGVSSIEYTKQVPGVSVVTDSALLEDELISIVSDKNLLLQNANKTHAYACQHIDLNTIRRQLYGDFMAIINNRDER